MYRNYETEHHIHMLQLKMLEVLHAKHKKQIGNFYQLK